MRVLLILAAMILGACRPPYMADYADMTVLSETFPPTGADLATLGEWFYEHGYAPGPKVLQTEAELRRRPGDPLIYALAAERRWWLSQTRTVRHFCVTRRVIYYRFGADGRLAQAIQTHRSQC